MEESPSRVRRALKLIAPDAPASGSSSVQQEKRRRAFEALLGQNCPLLLPAPTEHDVATWVDSLYNDEAFWSWDRVHIARRNRELRRGNQWLSSNNKQPWRQPVKPRDAVRAVMNFIGPALDWRLQVQTEQRPGVKCIPSSIDPENQRRAKAGDALLEYQYRQQRFGSILREAMYWAQTDGCAFVYNFWNPERGQDDLYGAPLGDVDNCVYRIEQVRVQPGATANRQPHWVMVRETLPLARAIAAYGDVVADESRTSSITGVASARSASWQLQEGVERLEENRSVMAATDTVDRTLLFVAPIKRYLPRGMAVVVVGERVVYLGPLLNGRIPILRITDGSSDPSYFPEAIMDQWVDEQRKLNAIFSKWIESIRKNSGGRVLSKANAIVPETMTGGSDLVMEFRSPGSIDEVVRPVQGFSIGEDAKEAMQLCIHRLEYMTGYNDNARGNVSASASGRAILANREQLERVFAPPVFAASEFCEAWGVNTLAWCAAYYDVPRKISTLGLSNPLLGRSLASDDLDPTIEVFCDGQAMMPMPQTLRLFLLDDQLAKGVITPEQYHQKLNFTITNDLYSINSLQEAYAMRIVDAIKAQQPLDDLMRAVWQLDEKTVQDVLEREIILSPDAPTHEKDVALEVWDVLGAQAAQKAAMGMAVTADPNNPQAQPQPVTGGAEPLDPSVAPTMAMPSTQIPTQSLMAAQSQESLAADLFERTAPQ